MAFEPVPTRVGREGREWKEENGKRMEGKGRKAGRLKDKERQKKTIDKREAITAGSDSGHSHGC
jgi:hypothetical protein